jgi:hypothetical protein
MNFAANECNGSEFWIGNALSDKANNLEAQLNALAGQCDAGDAGAPDAADEIAPTEDADASPESGDDLAGSDFADQVQKMLDEAAASIEPSDEASDASESPAVVPEPSVASEEATSAEPVATAEEPEVEEKSADETLIDQIDSMLAEAADDSLAGDFESIDEVEASLIDQLPTDPGVYAEAEHLEADATGELQASAAEEPPSIEGDFESVDEVAMQTSSTMEQADEAEGADEEDQAELSEAAAAVAAELDADEAIAGDFEAPDALEEHTEDEPATENVAAKATALEPEQPKSESTSEPAVEPAAKTESPAEEAEAETAKPARRPDKTMVLLSIMAKINKPLDGLSDTMKNVVGTVALATLALAFACFVIAALGRTAGLIVGMPIVMLVTAGAAYFLLLKPPGDGNDHPSAA